METVIKEKEGTDIKEEKSGKRKWLSRFVNFLMYGGWLLIVLVILGVVILISYLG
ncbi:MAG: hypothetical protein Q8N70_05505 [Deltaproteobacteria bacterium]|nr:hypothetical protein [Deltaproteobacteria bacterium]